ncbi:unnamed protein product [Polarella glacialis]|uniref:CSD domain-containing protein n=1 Tax=Polarella glacialis TaxID=89957 RepID=A0A813E5G0_POLGL|nr:unnamed protein product [Polarella glacialis]
MTALLTGVVKKWRGDKGCGFLTPDSSPENWTSELHQIWVHRSGLVDVTDLVPGDEVSFRTEDDGDRAGKVKAVEVTVTASGSAGSEQAAQAAGVLCNGIVKRWIEAKGFGFLMTDGGGEDVWVHRSGLVDVSDLNTGDKVSFHKVDDGKGRGQSKAINVVVVEAGSPGNLFADLPPASEDAEGANALTGMDLFLELAGEMGPSRRTCIEDFVLVSSLNCEFLVVAEGPQQLVNGLRAPTSDEFERLLGLVEAFVAGCEASEAVLIVDFEGEMPGYGGELSTAQLQLTSTVDATTLVPRSLPSWQRFSAPGLLLDLRSQRCVAVLRRIMQSSAITKLAWGADGDCQSLLYQVLPHPLGIEPKALVDAQLGFDSRFRVGMARMLEHVPAHLVVGLPTKEQIDWDAFHSQNRRALPMPLDHISALYAVDDLHRMEAILGSKLPPSGSYIAAREITEQNLVALSLDPLGLQALQEELVWFEKKEGIKRTVKAVQVARHIFALRARGAGDLGAQAPEEVLQLLDRAEAMACEELTRAGVVVASDLSFNEEEDPSA